MSELFAEQLEALRAGSLYRQLHEIGSPQEPNIEVGGKRLVNFSSNDYLGLANEPRLPEAAIATMNEFGLGAGASRLVSGTQSPDVRLKNALARWKQTETALSFSSGYAAALGTDAKLSGAVLRVFPHNGLAKLESLLVWAHRAYPQARILIVTESVFSMDGDRAPLRELVELKNRFQALLLVDEAHAIGVIGPNGRGLAAEEEVDHEVDVQMGTLSKALGASGGYICGSRRLVGWLTNRARSFVFPLRRQPPLDCG